MHPNMVALSNDIGVIDVLWSTEEIDNEIFLLARWQESDGPTIDAPKRSGFGSKLIVSSLNAFGEVALEYAPVGLVLTVKMPLSKVQFRNELSEL
jgi:two-component sensor histidine kinase